MRQASLRTVAKAGVVALSLSALLAAPKPWNTTSEQPSRQGATVGNRPPATFAPTTSTPSTAGTSPTGRPVTDPPETEAPAPSALGGEPEFSTPVFQMPAYEPFDADTGPQEAKAVFEACRTSGAFGSCLSQVLVELVAVADVSQAMSAFEEFTASIDDGPFVCHQAAHAAGAAAFNRAPDQLRETLHAAGTGCMSGFIHGVLETYAASNPGNEALVRASLACNWPEQGGELGECYDGIGHAAWTSNQNLPGAVQVCAALEQGWHRRVCEVGIVMQIYQPAYIAASYQLSESRSELVDMCALWPEIPTVDGTHPKHGCWEGVAYMISTVVTDTWFQNGMPDVTENLEFWTTQVSDVFSTCRQLEHDGPRTCAAALARNLHAPWSGNDIATTAALCQGVGEYRDDCVREAGAMAALDPRYAGMEPNEILVAVGLA